MKTQLDKLEAIIGQCLDETNRWEIPKEMKKQKHGDDRDYERGAWNAFMFIGGQIRSIRRKSKVRVREGR